MSKPDAAAGAAPEGTASTNRLRATRMPAASTTMDSASPSPDPTSARNLLRARYTPTANRSSTIHGSTRATLSSAVYADWAFTSVSAFASATVGWTSGTRFTAVRPAALRRFLASLMNGDRSRTTSSPRTTTASLSPDSTASAWSWAVVIAWSQTDANLGLATRSAIRSWTKPVTAEVSVGVRVLIRSTSCGGRPCAASALTASSSRLCTSTYWKTTDVSRSVSRACTSGSSIRGLIVRTKRSVSDTWLWTQTETPATGASTQARTISTTASTERAL